MKSKIEKKKLCLGEMKENKRIKIEIVHILEKRKEIGNLHSEFRKDGQFSNHFLPIWGGEHLIAWEIISPLF